MSLAKVDSKDRVGIDSSPVYKKNLPTITNDVSMPMERYLNTLPKGVTLTCKDDVVLFLYPIVQHQCTDVTVFC